MQCHLIQPGDATMYSLVYGIIPGKDPRWPFFFFAFGTGTQHGRWMQYYAPDIPSFSFSYFASSIGYDPKKDKHSAQVAFTIFLHIVGQQRYPSDKWDRETELNWNILEVLPTLTQLMEDFNAKA